MFDGRARRKEYWFFILFNVIIALVLGFIDGLIGIQILSGIYFLAVLIPGIAVAIRRLHDTDRSRWWLLIAFVPLIGAIIVLVLMVLEGTPGGNKYGPNPRSENI